MQLSSPQRNPEGPEEVVIHSPEENERDHFVSTFALLQEVLKIFDIEVREKRPDDSTIEGTVEDPRIKDQMYDAVVRELHNGSTYALEFMLGEELLSRQDFQKHGAKNLKDIACKILQESKGAIKNRDRDSFINSGILTPTEAADAFYSSK